MRTERKEGIIRFSCEGKVLEMVQLKGQKRSRKTNINITSQWVFFSCHNRVHTFIIRWVDTRFNCSNYQNTTSSVLKPALAQLLTSFIKLQHLDLNPAYLTHTKSQTYEFQGTGSEVKRALRFWFCRGQTPLKGTSDPRDALRSPSVWETFLGLGFHLRIHARIRMHKPRQMCCVSERNVLVGVNS